MQLQSIRDIPEEDRPRERLQQHGPDAMTTAELLAIILGSGMRGKSVLQLSQEIISHFGNLERLGRATLPELCQIKGLGPAKAIQLMAALGLGVRVARQHPGLRQRIHTPGQVYELVRDELVDEKRELFMVVLLDVKGYLIRREVVSVGTLSRTLVHPREVFYPAIRYKASTVILVHNHPSGDPAPSSEDISLTKNLVSIGDIMGIPVNDHIIAGTHTFASMRQEGLGF